MVRTWGAMSNCRNSCLNYWVFKELAICVDVGMYASINLGCLVYWFLFSVLFLPFHRTCSVFESLESNRMGKRLLL